jgi:hypothetical protein
MLRTAEAECRLSGAALAPHKHGIPRRAHHHDLLRRTIAWMISMVSETAVNRYRREAEECRQNADRALLLIDREAWLRLAGHWDKLLRRTLSLTPCSKSRARRVNKLGADATRRPDVDRSHSRRYQVLLSPTRVSGTEARALSGPNQ